MRWDGDSLLSIKKAWANEQFMEITYVLRLQLIFLLDRKLEKALFILAKTPHYFKIHVHVPDQPRLHTCGISTCS